MGVPPEIPGFGSSATVLRVARGFDPQKAGIGPDEYFVLSRIDGVQSVRAVLNDTGLPVERGIAIVLKLRELGAVLMPGETAAPITRPQSASLQSPFRSQEVLQAPTEKLPKHLVATGVDAPTLRRGVPAQPPPPEPGPELSLDAPNADELAALAETCDLPDGERRRVLAMHRLVVARDPWALLGVPRSADRQMLKRAYFKLSKDIHPDRFYGKRLGSFSERLAIVFEAVSRAYARLTSPEAGKQSGPHAAFGEQPQSPQDYAAELFDRACSLEVTGEPLEAMKLFAAAVRVDPQTRYLRRAATCALTAGQPKTAVEYAKKAQTQAPDDASAARLLATAFRAVGKLSDAEEVLVLAMAMKIDNDTLMLELRNDLAEVRRLLAT